MAFWMLPEFVAQVEVVAGAAAEGQHGGQDLRVDGVLDAAGVPHLLVEVVLLRVGERHEHPAGAVVAGLEGGRRRGVAARVRAVDRLEVEDRQGELFQVVLALAPRRGLADLLHRGEEQPDEDGDDGNDDEQLDQREPTA
jgi:hypothetical protein